MKTKRYMKVMLFAGCLGIYLSACQDGDKYFKEERYKKMIYAIGDELNVFHAEYEMTADDEWVATQPFAVSGTNPIDDDVHIRIELAPTLVEDYNFANYADETEKYAHILKEDEYELPTDKVEIKAHKATSYEVGKLPVRIKSSVMEKLSVDSIYFIPFHIAEGSPYEINELKSEVLFRVYRKNRFVSQMKLLMYNTTGSIIFPNNKNKNFTTQKTVYPLTYNSIRVYVRDEVQNNSDSEKMIRQKSMVLTVDDNNNVLISAYDPEALNLETLTPEDGSVYRNVYDPATKMFYLYYRYEGDYDGKHGWFVVSEILNLSKDMEKEEKD